MSRSCLGKLLLSPKKREESTPVPKVKTSSYELLTGVSGGPRCQNKRKKSNDRRAPVTGY